MLNGYECSKTLFIALNNALHRFNTVEFKACRLLEYWMRWKDTNELSLFAWHAALLLTNSDLWSVEATTIICDLLFCESDRFRQRAEMILRSKNDDDDICTSSKLGLDVLLTLATRKAFCQYNSASVSLTLFRVFESITVDVPSHLEAFFWLERYRIHALTNKEFYPSNSQLSPIAHLAIYFPSDTIIDVSLCDNISIVSDDLVPYLCDLITSNFSSIFGH